MMNIIQIEDYLEALNIVETYNQQCLELWNDLQRGDKIIFSKSMSKDILVEKEYSVYWVDYNFSENDYSWYSIKCENGKERGLRKYAKGYRVRITKKYNE